MAGTTNRQGRRPRPTRPSSPFRFQFWLHGVPAVIASLAGITAIIGTTVTVFCQLEIFICTEPSVPPVPVIETTSPVKAAPGQEIDIIGSHLDLVEEARLSKGLVVYPLFLLRVSDSKLIGLFPSRVPPEEYGLDFRIRGEDAFEATKSKIIVTKRPPPPVYGCDERSSPIIFAELDWASARLQNAIAMFIIEKGYG